MPGNLNLKKSWNPGLLKNQKKVWEEEQKALSGYLEAKKREEVLKKERDEHELLKLQYESNDSPSTEVKKKLNNLNWMYDNKQDSSNDGFNEMDSEFLLGKSKVEAMLKGGNYIDTNRKSRMETIISGEAKNLPVNNGDIPTDPLLKIKNERLKQSKILKNRNTKKPVDGSQIGSKRFLEKQAIQNKLLNDISKTESKDAKGYRNNVPSYESNFVESRRESDHRRANEHSGRPRAKKYNY